MFTIAHCSCGVWILCETFLVFLIDFFVGCGQISTRGVVFVGVRVCCVCVCVWVGVWIGRRVSFFARGGGGFFHLWKWNTNN